MIIIIKLLIIFPDGDVKWNISAYITDIFSLKQQTKAVTPQKPSVASTNVGKYILLIKKCNCELGYFL